MFHVSEIGLTLLPRHLQGRQVQHDQDLANCFVSVSG